MLAEHEAFDRQERAREEARTLEAARREVAALLRQQAAALESDRPRRTAPRDIIAVSEINQARAKRVLKKLAGKGYVVTRGLR